MFPPAKCDSCCRGDKVCLGFANMTCRQCIRDQKRCVCEGNQGECGSRCRRTQLILTCTEEATGPRCGTPKTKKVPTSGLAPTVAWQVTCQMAQKPPIVEESEVEEIDRSEVRAKGELIDSRSVLIMNS